MRTRTKPAAITLLAAVAIVVTTGCTRAIVDGVSIGITDGLSDGLAQIITDFVTALAGNA